mmetsp:Transcript_126064/g.299341  ORF Transcript_126064/g.299341 Transcript_126064/m.299341 type:complete len:211 (-) Transcript_126064:240-872(-)
MHQGVVHIMDNSRHCAISHCRSFENFLCVAHRKPIFMQSIYEEEVKAIACRGHRFQGITLQETPAFEASRRRRVLSDKLRHAVLHVTGGESSMAIVCQGLQHPKSGPATQRANFEHLLWCVATQRKVQQFCFRIPDLTAALRKSFLGDFFYCGLLKSRRCFGCLSNVCPIDFIECFHASLPSFANTRTETARCGSRSKKSIAVVSELIHS